MFVNQKPGTFARGVLWCKNPIFEAFLEQLSMAGLEARPATSEEYSSGYSGKNVTKAGAWAAEKIMLGQPDDIIPPHENGEPAKPWKSIYITVWCGMAVFEECISEDSEKWQAIQAIWRLL